MLPFNEGAVPVILKIVFTPKPLLAERVYSTVPVPERVRAAACNCTICEAPILFRVRLIVLPPAKTISPNLRDV